MVLRSSAPNDARTRLTRALVTAVALVVLQPIAAYAHDVRGSAVYLDIGQKAVATELHLPLAQLRLALDLPKGALLNDDALAASSTVREYLRKHVRATTQRGTDMVLEIQSASVQRHAQDDELVVSGAFAAERDSDARAFVLHYDAIFHRVVTHNAYVFARRDVWNGLLAGEPELLGMLHWQLKQLAVERDGGSAWRGFAASFQLGVQHIAEGTDHLMFLLLLLLAAPLLAVHGRWAMPKSIRKSVSTILKLVTAFTVGHSATLILGSVRGALLPAQLVEVLIAISIVISGVHALRPIFAGRESFIAAGFGFVHGLAFANTLRGFGFDMDSLVVALFGFNVGIEVMQLAVVLLVMPWLVLTANHPSYAWLRSVGATCGIVAGCGWVAERAFGSGDTLTAWVDHVAAHAPLLVAALAVYAVAVNGRAASALLRRRPRTDMRSSST